MRLTRAEAKANHTLDTGHQQFSETIYGVLCAACHNYILIDHTNCPSSCRNHELCRQTYAT
jgi:peptide subunit release factor RF-3